MNYKKLNIESIPTDLKDELLLEFHISIKEQTPFVDYRQVYENKNKNSIGYIEDSKAYETQLGGECAFIKFYVIKNHLLEKLRHFYKGKNEFLANCGYCFQLVGGGHYMAPHIDPPKHRTESMVYVLSPGNTPAVTTWYKPKEEFSHLEVTHSVCIPFDRLDAVEEITAETDTWYWYNVSAPHSVTNLSGHRMFLQSY
jgi:hypothetical protein